MPYLVVAVVLVGLIAGLNLLFTYGVIRRLKEHTRQIDAISAGHSRRMSPMREPGQEPDGFADQVTTDGQRLARDDLRNMLVGFFSPGCVPCQDQSRVFAQQAAMLGPGRTLAVVAGNAETAADLLRTLEPATRVLVEPDDGTVQRAFAVSGYPALCVLDDDGRIAAAGHTVASLPDLLPA